MESSSTQSKHGGPARRGQPQAPGEKILGADRGAPAVTVENPALDRGPSAPNGPRRLYGGLARGRCAGREGRGVHGQRPAGRGPSKPAMGGPGGRRDAVLFLLSEDELRQVSATRSGMGPHTAEFLRKVVAAARACTVRGIVLAGTARPERVPRPGGPPLLCWPTGVSRGGGGGTAG